MSKHPDAMGDRMKDYEGREAKRKFLPMLPVIARIDGRTFSKFTKPFDKPFDERLSDAMRETTKNWLSKLMLISDTYNPTKSR
jgi:tRNA(His) guanylyltransferase